MRAAVGGGYNSAASGSYSTVPGGYENQAWGNYSFAAGRRAQSTAPGAFTWADSTGDALLNNTQDRFLARAQSGFYLYTSTDLSTGARLSAGSGTWVDLSDRETKENVTPVDPAEVLDKVARIPVSTWQYKAEPGNVRHMGPMAQDVRAAFGLATRTRASPPSMPTGSRWPRFKGSINGFKRKTRRSPPWKSRSRNSADSCAK